MRLVVMGMCIILFASGAAFADSQAVVARVKTVSGEALVARQGKVLAVKLEENLYKGDTLRTGPDSSLGITFKDNTTFSLGPRTEIVIDEFLFNPAQEKLSIVTRMIRGTVAYVSGIIGRLSPQSVRFETPVATVGIRGTKFLVKIDDE